MSKFILSVVSLALLFVASQGRQLMEHGSKSHQAARKDKFCSTPVAKNKVIFPENLIGRANVNYEMYSGYVNITSSPDYLFYWFFSSRDGNPNAPLIVWTNGGPGCSSMEGATTENSPVNLFDIKESCSGSICDYTGQLSNNPYAWNAHANVVYLDQPKNVGYSFGYGSETQSSVQAADEFIVWFQEWLKLFPEFVGRPLIIAGESYGGHYIPAWANAILDFNAANTNNPINFAGAAIGNGCVNDTVQNTDQFIDFQHEQNLIPADSNPRNQADATSQMSKYLGYTPNYYDYRVESISGRNCGACYGYNYTAWSYWFLQSDVLSALNVCGDAGNDAFSGTAGGCINMGAFDAHDSFDYSGAIARTLEAGIPVTLYYGKTDTACNYVGGRTMAETISWKGQQQFASQELKDFEVAGATAGQVKSYGGLTFVQVESAGHMVPLDQPAAASYAIQSILNTIKSSAK